MKPRILVLVGLAVLCVGGTWWWSGSAALCLPMPLKSVFWRIEPGMKRDEVAKLLASVYPKLKPGAAEWSGQTGYIGFSLDERYSLMVAAEFDPKQDTLFRDTIVYRGPMFYLFDNAKKLRFELRGNRRVQTYSWATDAKKA